jgi:type IX secretion system PorP/SprF family membrane protein
MKTKNLGLIRLFIISALFAGSLGNASAQLNPMGALYFQNQYLANPALAGMKEGLSLNAGYRKQWSSIPGSPAEQTITADYAITGKAGVGLNVYNDKAGLYKRTRSVASYAYHLSLNDAGAFGDDQRQLSFGLSVGFMNERVSAEDVNGDPNDAEVSLYNQRSTYIDGDFGMAYTSNKLSVQAALPNLKSLLKKDRNSNSVDRSLFYSAVSYKLDLNSGIGLEPKLAYRGVKGFNNIIDAGANLS